MYTKATIRITALTGSAATDIGGETTAREFGLMEKNLNVGNFLPSFVDTRLCIIDEISFMSCKTLAKLSLHLQWFTECVDHRFGSTAVVFLGDFCQLECIGGDPIFTEEKSIHWEQALTHMVELKGTHRYAQCPELSRILPEMRENGLGEQARSILNKRVINGTTVVPPSAQDARYATYHNKNRTELNADVFESYLNQFHSSEETADIPKTAIVIRAGAKWYKRNRHLTFAQRAVLYRNCSEAHCKNWSSKRCAPLLCLFSGCHVMNCHNDDVKNGVANGTTSVFERAVLKGNCTPKPMLMHGKWVYGIDISDVDHLVLRWHESRNTGTFKVHAREQKFNVEYPISEFGMGTLQVTAGIDMTAFPIVVNHATTGHKLQGKSMDQLVVAEWSAVQNWAYVVLSRVRTMEGLFLLSEIPLEIDVSPPREYTEMMTRLRSTILAKAEDMEEYRCLVTLSVH